VGIDTLPANGHAGKVSDISLQRWKKRGRAGDSLCPYWLDPPGRVRECLEFTLAGESKRVRRGSVSLITFLFFTLLLINVYLYIVYLYKCIPRLHALIQR